MAREIVIFINGILTNPGDAFAWTDDAVRWFNKNASERVSPDKFEYYTPALLRRITIDKNVRDLVQTIAEYASDLDPGQRLHLVGHSNGCELIARALQLTPARFASVHLISGAVERDFTNNGLGRKLEIGQVGAVFCYCSRGDKVLKYLARPSQVFHFLGLGYGDLGARGPSGIGDQISDRVETTWSETFGHSDWFAVENFYDTMHSVLANVLKS